MSYFRQPKIYLVCVCLVLVTFLSGCQGSDFGNWAEQAIAPEMITRAVTDPSAIKSQPVVLPANFPPNLPQPTGGKLTAVHTDNFLSWQFEGPPEQVLREYGQQLQTQNWQILQQSPQLVTAKSENLFVVASSRSLDEQSQLLISFFPFSPGSFTPSPPVANAPIPNVPIPNVPAPSPQAPTPAQTIIQGYIEDLRNITALEISPDLDLSAPIARREYVRWLVRTNNYLFRNRPSRQVRLASPTETPTFVDVPPSDPDFPEIQGMVNSGFLARAPQFRPDQPLTRQEMVHLKIPFDLGQLPPPIAPNQLQERWRFQDSDQISDFAQRAIAADALLGDSANIRRSFGFTSLFQPQRPVSRLEGLASLWFFGTPTDGTSARSPAPS